MLVLRVIGSAVADGGGGGGGGSSSYAVVRRFYELAIGHLVRTFLVSTTVLRVAAEGAAPSIFITSTTPTDVASTMSISTGLCWWPRGP